MCVWCERYAEGHERWYLNPANYARRLYKIRREEAEASGAEANPQTAGGMAAGGLDLQLALHQGDRETATRLKDEVEGRAWVTHFGQVVTLEEISRIIDIMYPIGRMTCACRRSMRGLSDSENFTCIGMGSGMYKWERWPETYRGGVEFLTPAETKDIVAQLNKKGYVQTVFTFGTPYIAGVCNCDYPDCSAIRSAVDMDLKVLWKGHHVARVDPERCNGCALCVARCQFKALTYSPSSDLAYIDPFQCYGCGLCRTPCRRDAISLLERASLPALANVW